jgi:hypothetical protein
MLGIRVIGVALIVAGLAIMFYRARKIPKISTLDKTVQTGLLLLTIGIVCLISPSLALAAIKAFNSLKGI